MAFLIDYFSKTPVFDKKDITVSVAESVTAGALANSLCSEPGASSYFKGGIVTYSKAGNRDILGVDVKHAENNNFANPRTTIEMARSVAKMFKSRIGMATTGYSLPVSKPENKELGECALEVPHPYAYICIYDSLTNIEVVTKVEFEYDPNGSKNMQRAAVQVKVALQGLKVYNEYVRRIQENN